MSGTLLREDGIVDDIAISIAILGTRVVRLTPTERSIVIELMRRAHRGTHEIAAHLGVTPETVLRWTASPARQEGYRRVYSGLPRRSLGLTAEQMRVRKNQQRRDRYARLKAAAEKAAASW